MSALYGWTTVVRPDGKVVVYARDCHIIPWAVDLAPQTFPTRREAEAYAFARWGKKPSLYRKPKDNPKDKWKHLRSP
jgi:hypothetical protein